MRTFPCPYCSIADHFTPTPTSCLLHTPTGKPLPQTVGRAEQLVARGDGTGGRQTNCVDRGGRHLPGRAPRGDQWWWRRATTSALKLPTPTTLGGTFLRTLQITSGFRWHEWTFELILNFALDAGRRPLPSLLFPTPYSDLRHPHLFTGRRVSADAEPPTPALHH